MNESVMEMNEVEVGILLVDDHQLLLRGLRQLIANRPGLIVVGEATIEPALDKVFTGNAKVVKREIGATIDQITSELQEAFKG